MQAQESRSAVPEAVLLLFSPAGPRSLINWKALINYHYNLHFACVVLTVMRPSAACVFAAFSSVVSGGGICWKKITVPWCLIIAGQGYTVICPGAQSRSPEIQVWQLSAISDIRTPLSGEASDLLIQLLLSNSWMLIVRSIAAYTVSHLSFGMIFQCGQLFAWACILSGWHNACQQKRRSPWIVCSSAGSGDCVLTARCSADKLLFLSFFHQYLNKNFRAESNEFCLQL